MDLLEGKDGHLKSERDLRKLLLHCADSIKGPISSPSLNAKNHPILYTSFLSKFQLMANGSFSAAAAVKSLQPCLTLCDPIDGSPPGSLVPGILRARTLEWVAISFSNA